jgi:hypothetical protein
VHKSHDSLNKPNVRAQKSINHDYLRDTLFIVPNNDGEAMRANQILSALHAPFHHVSRQRWGALIDNEWRLLNRELLRQVKRVLIFEMPGKERRGEDLVCEYRFRDLGLEVDIVDHHHYQWVDRHQEKSSLEQLCGKLGWHMDETDQAIAVNDRSHVPGLKQLGLSVEHIRKIRLFDLLAQGYSKAYVQSQLRLAHSMMTELERRRIDHLWILDNVKAHSSVILQELAIKQTGTEVVNLFEVRSKKMSFSGLPTVVDQLLQKNFERFGYQPGYGNYGGGDPHSSKFWGFKPASYTEYISTDVRNYVLDVIISILSKNRSLKSLKLDAKMV